MKLSKFGIAVIVAAVLITLGALAPLAFAQSTWPYPSNPMTWDANDPNPYSPSNDLGVYYMSPGGFDLPIKTVASDPDLQYYVEILDPDSNPVAEQYVRGTSENPEDPREYELHIPNGPLGQYKIRTKDTVDITDRFIVRDSSEIPEFPSVAVPAAGVLGLGYLFMRKKNKQA